MHPVQDPVTHTSLFVTRYAGRAEKTTARCAADNWRVSATIIEVEIDLEARVIEVQTTTPEKRERNMLQWDAVFYSRPTLTEMIDTAEWLARKQWSAVHAQNKVTPNPPTSGEG